MIQPPMNADRRSLQTTALAELYGFLRRTIIEFDRLAFSRWSVRRLYVLSWLYLLIAYGIGTVSFHPTFNVSQNPFVNFYKDSWQGHYLYESLPLPLIAYFTGLSTNYHALVAVCFVLLWSANAFLTWRVWRDYGPRAARMSIVIFVFAPISIALLMFVGEYDVITYWLQCLLFASANLPAVLLLGFAGGLQHFPIMLLSGLSLLCFRSVIQEGRIRAIELLLYGGGAFAGATLTRIFQQHYRLGIETGRLTYILRMSKADLVRNIAGNWLAYLFSLYGVLWLLALLLAWVLFRERRRAFWVFAVSNGVFFLASESVTDTTRVFALCSWPLLLSATLWLFGSSEEAQAESQGLSHFVSGVSIAGLAIPHMIVWQGQVYSSFLGNVIKSLRTVVITLLHRQ